MHLLYLNIFNYLHHILSYYHKADLNSGQLIFICQEHSFAYRAHYKSCYHFGEAQQYLEAVQKYTSGKDA